VTKPISKSVKVKIQRDGARQPATRVRRVASALAALEKNS